MDTSKFREIDLFGTALKKSFIKSGNFQEQYDQVKAKQSGVFIVKKIFNDKPSGAKLHFGLYFAQRDKHVKFLHNRFSILIPPTFPIDVRNFRGVMCIESNKEQSLELIDHWNQEHEIRSGKVAYEFFC